VVHRILLELPEQIISNPTALPYQILDKCTAVIKMMKNSPSTTAASQRKQSSRKCSIVEELERADQERRYFEFEGNEKKKKDAVV
jgi:hypothetical protein